MRMSIRQSRSVGCRGKNAVDVSLAGCGEVGGVWSATFPRAVRGARALAAEARTFSLAERALGESAVRSCMLCAMKGQWSVSRGNCI